MQAKIDMHQFKKGSQLLTRVHLHARTRVTNIFSLLWFCLYVAAILSQSARMIWCRQCTVTKINGNKLK